MASTTATIVAQKSGETTTAKTTATSDIVVKTSYASPAAKDTMSGVTHGEGEKTTDVTKPASETAAKDNLPSDGVSRSPSRPASVTTAAGDATSVAASPPATTRPSQDQFPPPSHQSTLSSQPHHPTFLPPRSSSHPSPGLHHHQQNLFPLGPQQMFSCLVPDCVYSTPLIDDYRSHVQLFHPHLQLDLLKHVNAFPSPPSPYHTAHPSLRGASAAASSHLPLHHSTPHPNGVGRPFGSGAGGAPPGATAIPVSPFQPSSFTDHASMGRREAISLAGRSIDMHKCIAPNCDYYRFGGWIWK